MSSIFGVLGTSGSLGCSSSAGVNFRELDPELEEALTMPAIAKNAKAVTTQPSVLMGASAATAPDLIASPAAATSAELISENINSELTASKLPNHVLPSSPSSTNSLCSSSSNLLKKP